MEFRTKKQIFGAAIMLSATLFASTENQWGQENQ